MNILLVDDNIYTLEGLRMGIDYGSLGFEQVYEAKRMSEAIEILKNHKIDIVLTDIEMPNGSGLDLLKWINVNCPDVVTLFCTSYADFNYAKKAVELQSFDYYLKPIKYDELYVILERAVEEVEKRKKQKEKTQMGEYWLKNLGENKNHFWEDVLFRIFTYSEDELENLAVSRYLDYRNESIFSIGAIQFIDDKLKIKNMSYSIRQFVVHNILEELFTQKNITIEGLLQTEKGLWIFIVSGNPAVVSEKLRLVLDKLIQKSLVLLHCEVSIGYSCNLPLEEVRSRYMDLEEACFQKRFQINSVSEISAMVPLEDEIENEENDSVVERVKEYINEHYNEEITRESIGAIVYHNSAYLARVFKLKTGETPGAYLMNRRIEMAKKLLIETDMAVSEVAIEVGYDNFAYFSRLFKRKTGYTPKDYKRK